MNISVRAGQLGEVTADALVVGLFEGVKEPGGATRAVDGALGGAITRLIATGDFAGKLNQLCVLYPTIGSDGGLQAARVLLVGLGKQDQLTLDRLRQIAATAARRARDLGAHRLATALHGAGAGGLAVRQAAQALAEGSVLGTHRFDRLKSRPADTAENPRRLDEVVVVELDEQKVPEIEAGLRRGVVLAESTTFARDLVTEPGNFLNPVTMAEACQEMASQVGLRCEVLGPAEMAELKMGCILGVGQGSVTPPQLIILEHTPDGAADARPVVLCGKSITFDTGGISLKQPEGMWEMKSDMGGGAAVAGALRALALLDSPQRTIGVLAAAENMPAGNAIRPGDVLRAMDGQTIEIISTDAEGRLVLADALAYSQRYKPVAMLDVATLTGGVVTALGHGAAGIMGNDADVIARLKLVAGITGENVWELPLWDDEYKRSIRSDIADMKNSGGRAASAIGGGMLLKQFAKKVPWAHIDIAGVAWAESDSPYRPKGATGYGVRLLAEFAAAYAE